jgi:hypothetical protein
MPATHTAGAVQRMTDALRRRFTLSHNDLLRDRAYRRLWLSILLSSFGNQLLRAARRQALALTGKACERMPSGMSDRPLRSQSARCAGCRSSATAPLSPLRRQRAAQASRYE